MLTPSHYWRIARSLDELREPPSRELELPSNIAGQSAPPAAGDGIVLAAFDDVAKTGILRHLGLVLSRSNAVATVNWRACETELWIDTPSGRGNWKQKDGFRFADTKVAGYGLHELFAETFEGLEVRESLPAGAKAVRPPARERRGSSIAPERLNPIQVCGEPTSSPRGGYVYVLKSAYGYKVGRTRNVPNRMRAFGVHLPIVYSIPLCCWFDDHVEAESTYHRIFADKRINGEWFDLGEGDLSLIQRRDFQ